MEINGFEVIRFSENGTWFLKCANETIPEYHLINIIKIAKIYENIFEPAEHVLNRNIFGMVVDFRNLKELYNYLNTK